MPTHVCVLEQKISKSARKRNQNLGKHTSPIIYSVDKTNQQTDSSNRLLIAKKLFCYLAGNSLDILSTRGVVTTTLDGNASGEKCPQGNAQLSKNNIIPEY